MKVLYEKIEKIENNGNTVLVYSQPYVLIDNKKHYVYKTLIKNEMLDFPHTEIRKEVISARHPTTFKKVTGHTVTFIKH